MQTLTIPGPLPGLNDIIDADRADKHQGAKLKKIWTETVGWTAKSQKLQPVAGKVNLTCSWYEPNRRRDPDNIHSGGMKLILDGLVDVGILRKDSQKYIGSIHHHEIQVDTARPRVEVTITEIGGGTG